jgi:thiamine-phosphate pyrophosphorylase
MLLYYITDRKQFPGDEAARRNALLRRIVDAASAGVDYIQLREKDLGIADLERLAREAVRAVRDHSSETRLLINARTDIAIAVGADGVHLTSRDIPASDARAIWAASLEANSGARIFRNFTVAVSCHSTQEVRLAESHGADFAVLAPIFEKSGTAATPLGLEVIRAAAGKGRPPDLRVEAGDHRVGMPVLALGGITVSNAAECLRAGAAGIAGIRLFQADAVSVVVNTLRNLD